MERCWRAPWRFEEEENSGLSNPPCSKSEDEGKRGGKRERQWQTRFQTCSPGHEDGGDHPAIFNQNQKWDNIFDMPGKSAMRESLARASTENPDAATGHTHQGQKESGDRNSGTGQKVGTIYLRGAP